ncbi:MAG: recombinase family protein [Verrucomicrobia bacterium]|nr:recombinase family protein [Verrucomicrobiota bacterium]
MRIDYARLSEEDQALPIERQTLCAAGCGQVYEECVRGKTARGERVACLQALRTADRLVVRRLGRMGRSLSDVIRLRVELQAREILLASRSERVHAGSPAGRTIAASLGVAPLTVYRNLSEIAGPDGPSENPPTAYA